MAFEKRSLFALNCVVRVTRKQPRKISKGIPTAIIHFGLGDVDAVMALSFI
jgi:hypothetical protein